MKQKKRKVAINSEILYSLIQQDSSIRKIGPSIGCNEKTIRRGLKDNEMTAELVYTLANKLRVDPNEFAAFDEYVAILRSV